MYQKKLGLWPNTKAEAHNFVLPLYAFATEGTENGLGSGFSQYTDEIFNTTLKFPFRQGSNPLCIINSGLNSVQN